MFVFLALITLTTCLQIPLNPTIDDFYNPPKDLETSQLGDVLKWRKMPFPVTSMFVNLPISNAWQISVRSQDTLNNSLAIVATILEPPNGDKNKLISHQAFENSPLLLCSPSYSMQVPSFETFQIQADLIFISGLLSQGWYVVVPDYEGPNSVFPVGRQSAYSVLDSIRGTIKFFNSTGNSTVKTALLGYSYGAVASLWASIVQPNYAPELELVGAAVGCTIPNITAFIEKVDEGPYSGLIVNIFNGLANEYRHFRDRLIHFGALQPLGCLFPICRKFFFQKMIGGVYDAQVLTDETIKETIEINNLLSTRAVPQIPVFLFHSKFNEMSPFLEILKLEKLWCSQLGVNLEIAEDMSYNHTVEAFSGMPAAITWIEKRWNNSTLGGCKHVHRLSNFEYPGIAPFLSQYFRSSLQMVLNNNRYFNNTTR